MATKNVTKKVTRRRDRNLVKATRGIRGESTFDADP